MGAGADASLSVPACSSTDETKQGFLSNAGNTPQVLHGTEVAANKTVYKNTGGAVLATNQNETPDLPSNRVNGRQSADADSSCVGDERQTPSGGGSLRRLCLTATPRRLAP